MALEPGSELGPWVIDAVDPEHMKTTSVLLADPNPIHLDREAVRALGMGDRRVNQGTLNFGYLVSMLEQAVPTAQLERLGVRFLANVFEGDRVIAAGRVDEVEDTGQGRRLTCSVWLDVDGGARALDGTATLLLPE